MASERDREQVEREGMSGQPLLLAATFAAGAAAALATKALLHSRRKRKSDAAAADQDLPTVLRRAGLDLAIAATNQAAESLSREPSTTTDEEPVPQRP